MGKRKTIYIVIFLLLLIFNILCVFSYIGISNNINIESKDIWITSNVISSDGSNTGLYPYYVRYDDHNGEKGILYTDKKGYNLSIGDVATVYRNANSYSKTDSTHGWSLSKNNAISYSFNNLIIFVIFTIINIVILYKLLRKR